MTTEANDTPTNATEGRVVAWLNTHGVKNKWPIDDDDCICDLYHFAREIDAQLTETHALLKDAEANAQNLAGLRHKAEAENVMLREALRECAAIVHDEYCDGPDDGEHNPACATAQSILKDAPE